MKLQWREILHTGHNYAEWSFAESCIFLPNFAFGNVSSSKIYFGNQNIKTHNNINFPNYQTITAASKFDPILPRSNLGWVSSRVFFRAYSAFKQSLHFQAIKRYRRVIMVEWVGFPPQSNQNKMTEQSIHGEKFRTLQALENS